MLIRASTHVQHGVQEMTRYELAAEVWSTFNDFYRNPL